MVGAKISPPGGKRDILCWTFFAPVHEVCVKPSRGTRGSVQRAREIPPSATPGGVFFDVSSLPGGQQGRDQNTFNRSIGRHPLVPTGTGLLEAIGRGVSGAESSQFAFFGERNAILLWSGGRATRVVGRYDGAMGPFRRERATVGAKISPPGGKRDILV